jgi:NurA-like 5'-3' nuclease
MDIQKAIHVLFNECEIIYDMTNFNIEEYKKDQGKQLEAIVTIKQELDQKDTRIEILEETISDLQNIMLELKEKMVEPIIDEYSYNKNYKMIEDMCRYIAKNWNTTRFCTKENLDDCKCTKYLDENCVREFFEDRERRIK